MSMTLRVACELGLQVQCREMLQDWNIFTRNMEYVFCPSTANRIDSSFRNSHGEQSVIQQSMLPDTVSQVCASAYDGQRMLIFPSYR